MNRPKYDVIVVGSGPAGVHAAFPLINAGLKVAMIDAGEFKGDLKIKSNKTVAQSFSKGGFSNAWFGLSDFFDKDELNNCGLPSILVQREYEDVSRKINLQVKPLLGRHGVTLATEPGFYPLPLAWDYRTSKVVDNFKKKKNFTHIPQLVSEVKSFKSYVEVITETSNYFAKYIILAAGAINTTRILLKSLNKYDKRVSLLTKPNEILICLNLRSAPHGSLSHKNLPFGHGQLGMLGDAKAKSFKRYFVQFYEPSPERYPLLKVLQGRALAADIRFPGIPSSKKYCVLRKGKEGEFLEVSFEETEREKAIRKRVVSNLKKSLRSLGIFPIMTLEGTSHHFSGGANLLKINRVYIADSSSWKFLPAKPHTLTIMANASRIGKEVLKKLKNDHKTI